MHFEKDGIYHIYNQGNNKQMIFFSKDNYLFFLKKMKTHIVPFADIFAWCLMPNHFHLMILVNEVELLVDKLEGEDLSGSATLSRTPRKIEISLQKSIGIMLASYTRAINKQKNRSGSLFRSHTKAQCINKNDGITPSFYNTIAGTIIHVDNPEKQYPQACFDYIHQNPVQAKLVKNETDWEFSSAKDYAGIRNGKLVNIVKTKEYINI
jgi:putative transposase